MPGASTGSGRTRRRRLAIAATVAGAAVVAPMLIVASRAEAIPDVAVKPASLTATRLQLEGFQFDGVVDLNTHSGTVRALKFTMDRSVLDDVTLIATSPNGLHQRTRSNPLTVSGNVEIYASRFTGELDGAQVTYTPDQPPPSTLPEMTFTAVDIDLVLLVGDRLSAAALRQS